MPGDFCVAELVHAIAIFKISFFLSLFKARAQSLQLALLVFDKVADVVTAHPIGRCVWRLLHHPSVFKDLPHSYSPGQLEEGW